MIPDLRKFMIPNLRRFTTEDFTGSWFRIFAGSWFRIFADSRLEDFAGSWFLSFTYSFTLQRTADSREIARSSCYFRILFENLFHEIQQTRRFEGVRFFLNSPTMSSSKVPLVHPTVSFLFFFFFFHGLDPQNIYYLFILACGVLHPLDLENV
jgi:hypothetical protein